MMSMACNIINIPLTIHVEIALPERGSWYSYEHHCKNSALLLQSPTLCGHARLFDASSACTGTGDVAAGCLSKCLTL